jgi:hypothetical protein
MRYQAGKRTRLPPDVLVHLVAARYATTPDAVRAWPADDFLRATLYLEVTGRG